MGGIILARAILANWEARNVRCRLPVVAALRSPTFFSCVPNLFSSISAPPASEGALLALCGAETSVPCQCATRDRGLAPLAMQPCPAVAHIGGHMMKSAIHVSTSPNSAT